MNYLSASLQEQLIFLFTTEHTKALCAAQSKNFWTFIYFLLNSVVKLF